MTISIGDHVYTATPIPAFESGTAAVRLVKNADGAIYDLVRTHGGLVECDCADYEMRLRDTAGMCKHGAALVGLRLLPAPRPTPNEVPR